MKTTGKLRVGILFGGRSGEHEVSLSSAEGIMRAIDSTRYEVIPIGITKAGQWITGDQVMQQLRAAAGLEKALPASMDDNLQPLLLPLEPGGTLLTADRMPLSLDVIFPVLHGPYGEDGTVQGVLELAGIPYVGAGVAASAVCMDKALMKDIFRAHGLPIVQHLLIYRSAWEADPAGCIARLERELSYPMFTKPANLGSSVGVMKCHDREELRAGLAEAARYDRKLIVEQGIPAREIEVSVLGNEDPRASVPGEIVPNREFYSYAAKYLDDASELLIPAPLSPEQTQTVQRLAIAAYQAVDCAGMARCDFLMDRETGTLYLNELNTIPGFTPISMYPKLWEASGLSYTRLIDQLIQLALDRHAETRRSETSFDVSRAE